MDASPVSSVVTLRCSNNYLKVLSLVMAAFAATLQPAGQHRLARSRRPYQEDVVPACRCYFQCPLDL
jgi:hypothetical protein